MKGAAFFIPVLSFLILFSAFAVIADTQQPEPEVSADPAKIQIGAKPQGLVAFISDGDIWVMDTDGRNRRMVTDVNNARGRLSFSPDNKIIAFSREGKDINSLPSGEGGAHLLHDIFLAYLDSAGTRPNWWRRVTFELGAYYPDWSYDGKYIYYQKDINANYVDYIVPSHQLARVEVESGNVEFLRKDWQVNKVSALMPTLPSDGKKIAFGLRYSLDPTKYNFQNMGLKVISMDSLSVPESELRKPEKGLGSGYAPSWSPDGQWLAYVINDMRNPGVFIINSDLSDKRLVFAPTVTQQPSPHAVGWSPDSKWIVFAVNDGVIYTVDINGNNLTPLTGPGPHNNPAWSK